jgi:pimeloyl-ACP methyl ester carboxylesterase
MFDTSNYLRQIFNSPLAIPTSQIAKLPMGEMEYICVGSGKPILILHGGVGGSDQAYLMFRKMIPDGYQLICPSRPGYLGTPLSTGASVAEQADALVALLDYLQIEKALVVGVSAGGLAMYSLALRHPKRVQGIVAIAAIAGEYLGAEQQNKLTQNLFFGDIGLWMAKESMVYFPETMVKNLMNSEGYIDPTRVAQGIEKILQNQEQLGFIAELVSCSTNYRPREAGTLNDLAQAAKASWFPFAQIKCPALIIHGTHDAEVKFYHGVFAYEGLASKHKERIWLEYGTHFGFYFSQQASVAQQKFKDFIAAVLPLATA